MEKKEIFNDEPFWLRKIKKEASKNTLQSGVFENVLKLSYLLIRALDNKKTTTSEIKKQLLRLDVSGVKFSPFVKRFVLQNLPLCIKEISPVDERENKVLKWMHHRALTDKTLLHIDFVEYKRSLAKNFDSSDKDDFLSICSVTEQLISSDSKKTLFKSPDARIREIENDTFINVSEGVRNAIKTGLFFFKRERIHLSHKQTPVWGENYALLKKMCQKYYVDMSSKAKKCPSNSKKNVLGNERVKS